MRQQRDGLADRQVELRVVGAHSEVRDRLRFEKLQNCIGPINRHVSLRAAEASCFVRAQSQDRPQALVISVGIPTLD